MADVLKAAIDEWNAGIESLEVQLAKPEALLSELEKHTLATVPAPGQDSDEANADSAVEDLEESLGLRLCKVDLKPTEANFTTLGVVDLESEAFSGLLSMSVCSCYSKTFCWRHSKC